MRALPLRVVALVVGVLAVATASAAQTDDHVRFAADAEKARGHLLVSEQLYGLGQARTAALHAAHPVQELGNRLVGPVRRVDAARADRLRDTLKEPGKSIELKVPPARYAEIAAGVGTALDQAVALVVGAEAGATPAFRARVVAALIEAVAEEYDESFKDGRITQLVEYQDAYGFFRRAQTLYDALPPASRTADGELQSLSKAFPSPRDPPSPPLTFKAVKDLTSRIATSLRK